MAVDVTDLLPMLTCCTQNYGYNTVDQKKFKQFFYYEIQSYTKFNVQSNEGII